MRINSDNSRAGRAEMLRTNTQLGDQLIGENLADYDEEEPDADDSPVKLMSLASFRTKPKNKHKLTTEELVAVILVYAINFTDSLGTNISLPIMPFYAKSFHASALQIGYLYSGFAISMTFGLPFLSKLSDMYGRRFVMLISLAGTALGSLWQAYATSYIMFLLARIFSGVWAGISSACQVYIADTVPPALRPWYVNYLITSSQAALLFGPSIGAGLSVLGLNVPLITNGVISLCLVPIVFYYLPESQEWLHLKRQEDDCRIIGLDSRVQSNQDRSENWWGTRNAIMIYGAASFTGMVAQSSFASMYAVFASGKFQLDSLHVGFILTLGAIASVGGNIWISPRVQTRIGDVYAGVLGSSLVLLGALLIPAGTFNVSLLGLIILFQGVAINGSAIACGASDLTDAANRSTVMTGVRMFKSGGAVFGPSFTGSVVSFTGNVDHVFGVVSVFAIVGMLVQLGTRSKTKHVLELVNARKAIRKSNKEVWAEYGQWQQERGTPDEIRELGNFMADLLTKRNYRWVTYQKELQQLLEAYFPPLATESREEMAASYKAFEERVHQAASNQAASIKRQKSVADAWELSNI